MTNCLNAQGYEHIWHSTISTNISDAVLFFSYDNKPISFNKKMNALIENKAQKIEDKKKNGKTQKNYAPEP